MATDTWTDGAANWTTAADWSTGTVPGAGDNAVVPGQASGGAPDPQVTGNVGTVASVTNDGGIDFNNGGTLAVSGNFANNGGLTFDVTSNGNGGSSLTVDGTLGGTGSLSIGHQALATADTISIGALGNTSITLSGGIYSGATGKASLIVNSAAGFGTSGVLTGSINLYDNALLQFSSGAITSNQGNLFLSGADSFIADAGATTSNSALALSSNSGTLTLGSGASVSTPGTLANGGLIEVGVGTATTSTLTIGSAPGFGAAGAVNGAVSIGSYGTIAFTQAGQLTSIGVNSSLIIYSATAFTAAGSANGVYAFANLSGPIGVYGVSVANSSALMTLDGTGAISLDYGGSLTQSGSISNSGSIDVEAGSLTVNGTLTSNGQITIGTNINSSFRPPLTAGSSVLDAGAMSLTGGYTYVGTAAKITTSSVLLSGKAFLDLGGPANSLSSAITFASGASATLKIDAAEVPAAGGTFGNAVVGFAAGDTLDLRSLAYTSTTTATLSGNTLTVTNGSATDTLTLSGPGGGSFTTSMDQFGGTDVTVTCFCTGTRLRTPRGDIAVEALRVGETVVTASGERRPVRWIGHRRLGGRQAGQGTGQGTGRAPGQARALPHDQQPVRIRAGAFGRDARGHDLPARDLFLSPGHPVLVGADADGEGGHLVPIMGLVNGTTIARMTVESVTYWHVELDGHDILLAEGLPAESYLDWGDRAFFSDAPRHALADPDFVAPGLAGRCRPVAVDGPVVEAERRRLDAVFAATLAAHCAWGSGEAGAFAR